jgi:hypothetical protein
VRRECCLSDTFTLHHTTHRTTQDEIKEQSRVLRALQNKHRNYNELNEQVCVIVIVCVFALA